MRNPPIPPRAIEPDLTLDDEIESHIDKGQPQVEPGNPEHEARELPCGDGEAVAPEAAT